MAEENEYPLMLYRAGGSMLEWDGEMYDTILANDADEAKAAKAEGYSAGKPSADKAAKDKPAKAD